MRRRSTGPNTLTWKVGTDKEAAAQLHGRPVQLTRYTTQYEDIAQQPLSVNLPMKIPRPMNPMPPQIDPVLQNLKQLNQTVTDQQDPLKVQEKAEKRAGTLLSETDQRDYENIKNALKELNALGIKDPEIQEKIKKLEDRLLAFDDMATRAGTGTTYRRAVGAGEKKRVKVIQDELTKPSAATRQMKEKEKEVDDDTAAREADETDADNIAAKGPDPFAAADMDAIDNSHGRFDGVAGSSKYAGIPKKQLLEDAVWGEVTPHYFSNKPEGKRIAELRNTFTKDDRRTLQEIKTKYPDVMSAFLLEVASNATTAKTNLKRDNGKYPMNTPEKKAAAEYSMREHIRSMRPRSSPAQIRLMDRLVVHAMDYMRNPDKYVNKPTLPPRYA